MNIYGVINMDIVGSRKITDRCSFQNILISYIKEVNNKYIQYLTSPIKITLGDEWQIVLNKPSECYNIIHDFQKCLWQNNIEVYAGIAIGTINTDIYEYSSLMDGPVFIMAREALKIAKQNARKHVRPSFSKRNLVFLYDKEYLDLYLNDFYGNVSSAQKETAATIEIDHNNYLNSISELPLGTIINILIENNEILKSRMSAKQKQTYIEYYNFQSYYDLSLKINQSPSSISQKLNSAEYFTIRRNHEIISKLLGYYCCLRREQ